MRTKGIGLVALAAALTFATSASAELFTCHQRPGQVLYSYSGAPGQYGSRSSSSRSYTTSYSSRTRYQAQASYSSSRHYWNDRGRW